MRELSPLRKGMLEIWRTDAQGNAVELLERRANALTYEGADGLAAIASGAVEGSINAMYFGFDTSLSPAVVSTSANSTAADFRALNGSDQDFLRVRLSAGVRTASSGSYSGNLITFTGVAAADETGELDLVMTGGSAAITHAALVIAPTWADNTADFVYAVFTPDDVISVFANSGVSFRWQTTFTS